MKIGIGISTFNRRQVALDSLDAIKRYSGGCKIVVVDDGSDKGFPTTDTEIQVYRFKTPQGVARAKNKCLELLGGCDYIFLFDDDCFPVQMGWFRHYISESNRTGVHQLQFIFDKLKSGFNTGNNVVKEVDGLLAYSKPCGVMMFMTKHCIETIGGFDTDFGRYGYEHIEYSRRAFNAGLTPEPFMDIKGSDKLFYSRDKQQEIHCSFHNTLDKRKLYHKNTELYNSKMNDKHFKPYKELVTA